MYVTLTEKSMGLFEQQHFYPYSLLPSFLQLISGSIQGLVI